MLRKTIEVPMVEHYSTNGTSVQVGCVLLAPAIEGAGVSQSVGDAVVNWQGIADVTSSLDQTLQSTFVQLLTVGTVKRADRSCCPSWYSGF